MHVACSTLPLEVVPFFFPVLILSFLLSFVLFFSTQVFVSPPRILSSCFSPTIDYWLWAFIIRLIKSSNYQYVPLPFTSFEPFCALLFTVTHTNIQLLNLFLRSFWSRVKPLHHINSFYFISCNVMYLLCHYRLVLAFLCLARLRLALSICLSHIVCCSALFFLFLSWFYTSSQLLYIYKFVLNNFMTDCCIWLLVFYIPLSD